MPEYAFYRYINKECYLNIPTLARSEKSYNPVAMVRSYRLDLLEGEA